MKPTFRRIALVFGRAFLLAAVVAAAMRALGLVRDLRTALIVNMVFAGVMWPGFELLSPWYSPVDSASRPPGRTALISLSKILLLYALLVVPCIVLVRLLSGLDLLAYRGTVLFSFLVGLVITAFMSSLSTTETLVLTERARAKANVDRLRLEVLEKENARKTEELEGARALQLSMLPAAAPERADLEVAFGMRTASEVGGDYYDARDGGDGRLELVLGDATGHGTKAGLLVVAAKTLFQTEGGTGTPATALARANLGVKSLNLTRMNMALCRVSVGGGMVRLSAAGMPPALHYRAGTREVEEIVSDAPPAGQLRMARYADSEVAFLPGDRLLLFSDGFPECFDPGGEQFGYERAVAAFRDVAPRSPSEIVASLFSAADTWAAGRPYDDDVSFLVVACREALPAPGAPAGA
jgi:serine phosphatase RsbU (regulator of sigma subunit)